MRRRSFGRRRFRRCRLRPERCICKEHVAFWRGLWGLCAPGSNHPSGGFLRMPIGRMSGIPDMRDSSFTVFEEGHSIDAR